MLARRAPSCLRDRCFTHRIYCRRHVIPLRRVSTSASAAGNSANATFTNPPSTAALVTTITDQLDRFTPRFDLSADDIEIICTPSDFFTTLKTKILSAKRRIYLSTLYIGKTEYELVEAIRTTLQLNPSLKVCVLTDYLRGTREAPEPCCASLLATLVRDFGSERVEIRLFHTPNLTGFRKAIIPKRINEGWGLQHMKLYGIDDELILSGANLSNDYFTNRQDRYHLFKSKEVTDFFHDVHRTVSDLSYRVLPSEKAASGFVIEWTQANNAPAPLDDPKGYITAATKALARLIESRPLRVASETKVTDTQLYPLLQLTPLLRPDTSTELPAITGILQLLATPPFSGSKWTFTAGYFNMTPRFRNLLLASNPACATVIAASPWANGFYGSKGISGMLPAAYTHLSRRFLSAVETAGLSSRITLKEWRRGTVNEPGGWTYHAKGIWITFPGEEKPSVSLVGSSNYTKRSYELDLEANALIVTRNNGLKQRLGEEEQWLQEFAKPVTIGEFERTERRVGLHVRIAMAIVTLVGGAL